MADIVTMPKLGFDMAEGTLVRWVIAEGEPVAKGAVLAEIETDKATVEVESNFEGVVARHLVEKGAIVPVNEAIAVITQPGEEIPADLPTGGESKEAAPPKVEETPAVESSAAPAPSMITDSGRVKASPIARKIAADKGIDLSQVVGTGPGGRIIKKDIENYKPAPTGVAPSAPVVGHASQTIPLTKLRTAIARRMVESKTSIPHFYVANEFDVAAMMALRKQVNEVLPEGEKVSVNDFIIKAVAITLRQFPNLNASFKEKEIIQHGSVHIGVAVAIEGGLLTIVCRDADQKSVRQIAREVKAMTARAREGKVRPDDIEGSTFSTSNLGMFDVENFAAIINPPEAAILAIGTAKEVPVVQDGQLVPGFRMKATISVDHRVSDGVEAAQFMQTLKKVIEEPLRLLVG